MSTQYQWILTAVIVWFGMTYFTKGNLALNKEAYQYNGKCEIANRAVDGNTDPDDDSTCTFINTGDDSVSAWWFVDLGTVYMIHNVTVYNTNRMPDYQYLSEFYLRRGTENHPINSILAGCNTFTRTTPQGQSSTLGCPVPARYLMIEKTSRSNTRNQLTLCEVAVMGTEIICPHLWNPANGVVTYGDTTYNSVATYSCNEGFELIGDTTRKCSEDRNWSGTAAQCQHCKALQNPVNGFVTYQGSGHHFVATYRCYAGFVLIGSTSRECSEGGTWIGEEPNCQGCPSNCYCDEKNQCQQCRLWYVPERVCDRYLNPVSLNNAVDPVIQEVTQTTATIRFLQNQHDIPLGYENHYIYRLLLNNTDFYETFLGSNTVYHKSNQVFVHLTASDLEPGTSYTFRATIYRTHRGKLDIGTTDSKQVSLKTLSYTSSSSVPVVSSTEDPGRTPVPVFSSTKYPGISPVPGSSSTEDPGIDPGAYDGNKMPEKSDQAAVVLAVLFGILFSIAAGVIAAYLIRRYHHKRDKATEETPSTTKDGQSKAPTYENVTPLSTKDSEINPNGNRQEPNYITLKSKDRSTPNSGPYTVLNKAFNSKEGLYDDVDNA